MSDLLAHVPHTRLVPEGHYGPAGTPGVTARQVLGLAAATLAARKGKAADLVARLAGAGIPLADAPKAVSTAALTAVGTGPGRWLITAEGQTGATLLARLQTICGPDAAVTDQSDANVVLDIGGAHVRAALAKGVALDLDPRAFAAGDAATTVVSHVGITLWQTEEAPAYRVAVARSFAPAFLRWLTASAAEFGFALSGTGRG
ncbi:sarcosine oxidase subunit gamma family protein [Xanthobacter sp. V4C-4]|uniref:sarcosine oxidase subunit gamma n=1 Tax=Xanthobacter cornucopiae TaxID=3119924 RepID=UPI0037282172